MYSTDMEVLARDRATSGGTLSQSHVQIQTFPAQEELWAHTPRSTQRAASIMPPKAKPAPEPIVFCQGAKYQQETTVYHRYDGLLYKAKVLKVRELLLAA